METEAGASWISEKHREQGAQTRAMLFNIGIVGQSNGLGFGTYKEREQRTSSLYPSLRASTLMHMSHPDEKRSGAFVQVREVTSDIYTEGDPARDHAYHAEPTLLNTAVQ